MGISAYLGENNNEGNMEWIIVRQNTKRKGRKKKLVSILCLDYSIAFISCQIQLLCNNSCNNFLKVLRKLNGFLG